MGLKSIFKHSRYFQIIMFMIVMEYKKCDFLCCWRDAPLWIHCRISFFLTRPWTSQERSYVIGHERKWMCAIKWILAVSEAELFRIFLLRGTHWNSMGTLVIWLWAQWRRSVMLLLFSIFFIWLETSFVFIKCISLSTVYSTERSDSGAQISKNRTKTMTVSVWAHKKRKNKHTTAAFT